MYLSKTSPIQCSSCLLNASNGQIVDRCQGKTLFCHTDLYDTVVVEEEHCQKHTKAEILST